MQLKPLFPYVGIAAFALLIGLLAGYLNLRQRVPVMPKGPATTILLMRPGKMLPEFQLQNSDGKPFTRGSLSGQWSLLYVGYTRCTGECATIPDTLGKLTAQLQKLPAADRPHVYFISIDPAHDTAPVLRSFMSKYSTDFTAVTGLTDQLKQLTGALGINQTLPASGPSGSDAAGQFHSIMVVDPHGKEVAVYVPPLIPEQMADDYRLILKIQGDANETR